MKTLSEFIATVPNLEIYINFHSYSQLLMIPYGYTTERLDNYDEVIAIARKAADKLKERYGTEYRIGNIGEAICKFSL